MAIGGTIGGWGGMNGAQRRIALLLGFAYLAIYLIMIVGNAASMLSDLGAVGVVETWTHVGIWEVTSMIAWFSVLPVIWWLVAVLRPPRFSWWLVALAIICASVPVSLWHIGMMVALRKLAYAALGEEYRFFGVIGDRLLYEFRKDAATYLQAVSLAAIAQWLIPRAGVPDIATPEAALIIEIADGAVVHCVPVDEIDHVASAGNYVEVAWRARTLLHRATLAAVEQSLGPGFVRIHRSRLVRKAAVRRIEGERSGDFTVELDGGVRLRGSRRYRDGI